MTTPNDGGPAFPLMDAYGSTDKGMTLRDYFAAKAMHAQVGHEGMEGCDAESIAGMAYEMADAMLAAREKGGQ